MPRPPIELTPNQIAEVETLASVLSKEQIADYFGIDRNTLNAIMDRQPEVFQRYKKGKSKAVRAVGTKLLQKAMEGDLTSMIFYLKTQAGWSTEKRPEPIELPAINISLTDATNKTTD